MTGKASRSANEYYQSDKVARILMVVVFLKLDVNSEIKKL